MSEKISLDSSDNKNLISSTFSPTISASVILVVMEQPKSVLQISTVWPDKVSSSPMLTLHQPPVPLHASAY